MNFNFYLGLGLGSFITLFNFSCRHIDREGSTPQGFLASDYKSYLWPQPDNIPVCWEKAEPHQMTDALLPNGPKPGEIEAFQAQVKTRLTEEYKKAGFRFKGWNTCKPKEPGVHILISAGGVLVRGHGKQIDGVYAGMMIGFPSASTESALLGAVHEMGHVLGLRHEASRVEARTACAGFFIAESGEPLSLSLGPYDPDSVMNYCLYERQDQVGREEIARLSRGDIAALKEMYFGIIAETAEPLPYSIGVPRYETKVKNVDSYRFKYGPYAQTNCQDARGYSDDFSSEEPLVLESPSSLSGEVRLCLVGVKGDKKQALATASEYFVNVVQSPVFADYALPGSTLLQQDSYLPLNIKNSSSNLASVKYKVVPVMPAREGEPRIEPDCKSNEGYVSSPDIQQIKLELPADPKQSLIKLCIKGKSSEGKEQAGDKANSSYYFVATKSRNYLGFFPDDHIDFKKLPSRLVTVLYFQPFAGPERISYSFGPGTSCAKNWQEMDPLDPIILDLALLAPPIKSITVCIKQKNVGQVWDLVPTIKHTLTPRVETENRE